MSRSEISVVSSHGNAIKLAVAVLADAAGNDLAGVNAQLREAGFEITRYVPDLASQSPAPSALVVGSSQPITVPKVSGYTLSDGGIYMRDLEPAKDGRIPQLYMDDDYLRGSDGKPLILNFREAVKEVTKLNGGRSYGDGSEAALCKAIHDGTYQEGDRFVSWKADLNGRNMDGDSVCPRNLSALLKENDPAVSKIEKTLAKASGAGLWVVSGTEPRDDTSSVYHVRPRDGADLWHTKDVNIRSAVVLSRVRHAAPAA